MSLILQAAGAGETFFRYFVEDSTKRAKHEQVRVCVYLSCCSRLLGLDM